jgi:hypothetical protein
MEIPMPSLKVDSLDAFFDETFRLPGYLLNDIGIMQLDSLIGAYGLGGKLVLSNNKNSEDFFQRLVIELLHSSIIDEDERWRSLGLSYLEIVSLDFCLEAARYSLAVSYTPTIDLAKMLCRDRGVPQMKHELVNLGRSTFDEKFDELFSLLPQAFYKALQHEYFFNTGSKAVDAYVADMITTLKSMRGNP